MAKKKALAKFKSRSSAVAKRKPKSSFLSNPMLGEVAEMLLPAAAGYVGTRVAGRLSKAVLAPRIKILGRHAGPLGNLIALVATYFATKKVGSLRRYHAPAVAGSGIALLQTLLQTYFPGLAAILDDQAVGVPVATGDAIRLPARRPRPRTRYVVPGEITRENAAQIQAEQAQAGFTDESEDELNGEGEPDQLGEGEDEALPEDLLGENEDLSALYGGVFKQ